MKFTRFDVADYLANEQQQIEYLRVALAEEDPDSFLSALGDIARARSMAKISEATGLSRESLYKALKPGSKLRFETVQKVLEALGLELSIQPMAASAEAIATPSSAASGHDNPPGQVPGSRRLARG
nr:addiction module antidote protein [uncultured Gellertiella sp.]